MAVTQDVEELQKNKDLIRRAYDALNRGDMGEFASLLSDDFKELTRRGTARSKNECLAELEAVKRAMPDARYDIQDIIAEGDRVAVVENYSGTMKGEYRGSKPTGKRMKVTAVDIYRVSDGKIAEVRSVFDTAIMMQQLGI